MPSSMKPNADHLYKLRDWLEDKIANALYGSNAWHSYRWQLQNVMTQIQNFEQQSGGIKNKSKRKKSKPKKSKRKKSKRKKSKNKYKK